MIEIIAAYIGALIFFSIFLSMIIRRLNMIIDQNKLRDLEIMTSLQKGGKVMRRSLDNIKRGSRPNQKTEKEEKIYLNME